MWQIRSMPLSHLLVMSLADRSSPACDSQNTIDADARASSCCRVGVEARYRLPPDLSVHISGAVRKHRDKLSNRPSIGTRGTALTTSTQANMAAKHGRGHSLILSVVHYLDIVSVGFSPVVDQERRRFRR